MKMREGGAVVRPEAPCTIVHVMVGSIGVTLLTFVVMAKHWLNIGGKDLFFDHFYLFNYGHL